MESPSGRILQLPVAGHGSNPLEPPELLVVASAAPFAPPESPLAPPALPARPEGEVLDSPESAASAPLPPVELALDPFGLPAAPLGPEPARAPSCGTRVPPLEPPPAPGSPEGGSPVLGLQLAMARVPVRAKMRARRASMNEASLYGARCGRSGDSRYAVAARGEIRLGT